MTIVIDIPDEIGVGMKQNDCEECPAGWEDRGYEGECYDCGCIIYGEADGCRLTRAEITKRLRQWEEYQEGKIDRPQWVVNKFIRQMDRRIFSCPTYPPRRMNNGCHESIYSADQMRWDMEVTKSAVIHDVLEIIDGCKFKYKEDEVNAWEGIQWHNRALEQAKQAVTEQGRK